MIKRGCVYMARLVKNKVDRVYWTEGEGLLEVKQWVKDGLFDKQIAHNIGITPKTLIEWKKKYEVFNTVLDTGRGTVVLQLVNAMVKEAVGYYYQEQVLDNKGTKRVVRKWSGRSVPAGIFLLKNFAKDEFKDKWDVAFNGEVKNYVNAYEGLSTEELRKLAKLDETK